MNMFPNYKNMFKSLNVNTNDDVHEFVRKHNNIIPQVGYGLNEECGSDHYGYEIMIVSTDRSIIGFREINGCNCIHWAVLCTDKRQKKNYGKYVLAAPDNNNKLHAIKGSKHFWISEDLRPTELDPSF